MRMFKRSGDLFYEQRESLGTTDKLRLCLTDTCKRTNSTDGYSNVTKGTGHALFETTAKTAEITNEPPVTLARRQSTTNPE